VEARGWGRGELRGGRAREGRGRARRDEGEATEQPHADWGGDRGGFQSGFPFI
jgi:hypothetical protein